MNQVTLDGVRKDSRAEKNMTCFNCAVAHIMFQLYLAALQKTTQSAGKYEQKTK